MSHNPVDRVASWVIEHRETPPETTAPDDWIECDGRPVTFKAGDIVQFAYDRRTGKTRTRVLHAGTLPAP